MISRKLWLALAALLATPFYAQNAAPSQTGPAPRLAPEVIVVHGHILTGAHLRQTETSSTPREVTALAIARGSVLVAGNDDEVLRLRGPRTEVIDLHGAFAMPGFNDAHVHLYAAGAQKLLSVDLDHVGSLDEMKSRIAAYAAHRKPGSWVQGAGWDHTLWTSRKLPSRGDLDAVTGDHPAIFYRTDGHILVANSLALQAANITVGTKDPSGGQIDRDHDGSPTGIIRETPAMRLLEAKIPQPTMEERRTALDAAIQDALAHGVTSVQDFSPDWENFQIFEAMERAGKLHLRISEWQDFTLPVSTLRERRASHSAQDPLLHLGMLKGFADGSLGSRTAAMEDPYHDADTTGLPRFDEDTLNRMCAERATAGFQLGFHAIGDRANSMVLDAFAGADPGAVPATDAAPPADPDRAVVTQNSASHAPADLRFRVEHAQVLLPGDFDRFAKLGVIASMQPSHLLTDMNWAMDRLGPERARTAYAWKTFLDHGVTLAFGTDYPVESIDPFRGLYAAVTRQNEAATKSFEPQERISVDEAIYAYTQASAFAEFNEQRLGRLEPGYLADFVVLDRNPLTTQAKDLLHTRVLRTVLGGQTVYETSDHGELSPGGQKLAPIRSNR